MLFSLKLWIKLKYKTYEMIFFFLYICLEAGFGLKMSYMKDILCT